MVAVVLGGPKERGGKDLSTRSLHIFLTNARHESRFLKQANALRRAGLADEVILAAKWDPGLAECENLGEGIEVRRVRLRTLGLPKRLWAQLIKAWEWRRRVVRLAVELRPDAIVAHSFGGLGVGVAASRATGAPLLYDAHELETERNGLRGRRRDVERWLERKYLRRCHAMFCVSDSIADWYAREYGMERPLVVRNIPDKRTQSEAGDRGVLRRRFGIPDDALVFIYQGGLFRGRRVEQLIRVFARCPADRHVVFMGYGELEAEVQAAAARYPNIHHLPAVPPGEVLRHTAGADVGLAGVENICLSYFYSLPNKLFEYFAAGLPVVVPDFPEMSRVCRESGCGWVVGEDDDDWLERIASLGREEVEAGRRGALRIAPDYTWEKEEAGFLTGYRRALARAPFRGPTG